MAEVTVKQRRILLITLVVISFIYFISSSHIVSSNDGSHFALTAALVEEGGVSIGNFVAYTDIVDCAMKDGRFYSDRSPGTALLALPFYLMAKGLKASPLSYFRDNKKLTEVFVVFQPNISAVLGLLALFNIIFFLTGRFETAFISMVTFALGSLTWLEATHLYSHASSMATMMWAFYLALKIPAINRENAKIVFFIVFLLSFSSIIEIQNILFFPAFMLYFALSKKLTLSIIREDRSVLLISLGIFFCIYSLLIGFNYAAFNEITIKSNKYNVLFKEEKSFFSSLSGNFLIGLDNLFFSFFKFSSWFNPAAVKNKTPGIFIATPVFLFILPGLRTFLKKHRNVALFCAAMVVPNVLIAAFFNDTATTEIYTVTPLIFIPFFIFIAGALHRWNDETLGDFRRKFRFRLLILVSVISSARVFLIIHGQWNRNIFDFFPFLTEIPSFIVVLALFIAFWGLWRFSRKRKRAYI